MYILKCEAFNEEQSVRHANRCCVGDCHEANSLIPVTPFRIDATLENRRLDWEIGIQARVCCGRYEFVRSLSREWWVRKGQAVGLWDETKARTLMHGGSWHRTYERGSGRDGTGDSRNVGVSVKASARRVQSGKCPACGQKWMGEVCENCGHGASI